MKPIKIEISGWGPYTNMATIDFTSFDDEHLFLITGPTGSGKTTIFDAISFALFGKVSGSTRDTKSLRCDYADNNTKTYVTFEFIHHNHKYKITRNPTYERPKSRGAGFTVEHENVALIFIDQSKEPIEGIKHVNDYISNQLLHVTHDQFKQIMMIAQGEFEKLLFANADDKIKIFRNIFNTSPYQQFQKILLEHSNQFQKKKDTIEAEITGLLEALQIEPEHDLSILKDTTLTIPYVMQLFPKLEEYINQTNVEYKNIIDKLNILEEEINTLTIQITNINQNNEKISKYNSAVEELKKLEELEEIYKQKEEYYHILVRAINIKPYADKYHDAALKLSEITNALTIMNEEINSISKKCSEAYSLNKAALNNHSLINTKLLEINKWEKAVLIYDDYNKFQEEINSYTNNVELCLNKVDEIKELHSSTSMNIVHLKKKLNDFDILEKQIPDTLLSLQKQTTLILELERIEENINQYNAFLIEYEDSKNIYLKEQTKYNTQKIEFLHYEREYKNAQAGILAKDLVNGQPCLVCGATFHPNPAKLQSSILTENQLNSIKISLEKQEDFYNKAFHHCEIQKNCVFQKKNQILDLISGYEVQSTLLNIDLNEKPLLEKDKIDHVLTSSNLPSIDHSEFYNFSSNITTLLITAPEFNLDDLFINNFYKILHDLKNEHTSLNSFYKSLLLKKEEQEIIKNKIKVLELELEVYSKNLSLENSHLSSCTLQLETTKTKLLELKKNLIEDYTKESILYLIESNKTTIAELTKEIELTTANYASSKALLDKLIGKQEQLDTEKLNQHNLIHALYHDYDTQLKLNGFSDEQDYQDTILNVSCLDTLQKEIQTFRTSLDLAKTNVLDREQETKLLIKQDITNFINQQEEKIELKKIYVSSKEKIYAKLHSNTQILKAAQDKIDCVSILENEYILWKELSDTANGKLKTSLKIQFETYALAVYFEEILSSANIRLSKMTNGRYRLIRTNNTHFKQKKAGLDLNVYDINSGKERSVTTLSGGEIFKTSLSLALGLSDTMQNYSGGIEINTLFIDEGFGSLDSDSLTNAIDTLMEMSMDGDRMIGIISHVSELKERIEKQIVIKQNNNGSYIEINS